MYHRKAQTVLEWHRKNTSGPKIKNHTSVVFRNNLYIFGGYDGIGNHNKINMYDTLKDTWEIITPTGESPLGRNGHSATLAHGHMFVLGGWLGVGPQAESDLLALDLTTMSWVKPRVEGVPPGPCNMHSADYVTSINGIVVFRGGDGRRYMNDIHILYFNGTNLTSDSCWGKWETPKVSGTPPDERANHCSAVYDNRVYIFGGWDGTKRLNDMHIFDPMTLTWSTPVVEGPPPTPRAGMTLTVVRDKIFLFGGSGPNAACFQDLQVFDPVTLKWLSVETPTLTERQLHGGETDHVESENTMSIADYVIRGKGPSERAGHSASLVQHRLLIFGGSKCDRYVGDMFMLETDRKPTIELIPSHLNKLVLEPYFNNEEFADVFFIVEGHRIPCHKLILALASENFRCMFGGGGLDVAFKESIESDVMIQGIDYPTFMKMISFIYTGKVEGNQASDDPQRLSLETYLELLRASDRFMVDGLKCLCEKELSHFLTNENCNLMLDEADMYSALQLKELCLHYIRNMDDASS